MAVPLRPRAPPFAGLPAALTKRRLVGRMKKFGLDWGRGDLPGVTPTWVNPHWCPSGGTGRAPGASNPQKFRFRKPLRPAENSFSSKGLRVVNIFRCCATISTCSDAPTRDSLLKEIRPCRMKPVPEWRNWQTRCVQVAVLAREWRFESSFGHHSIRL